MKTSVAKRVATAALVLAAVPGLSACAAGFTAATDKVTADNAAGETGELLVRNLVLVKAPKASPAALAGTLINQGTADDVLERIELTEQTTGARTITVSPNLTLKPDGIVRWGTAGSAPLTVTDAGSLRVGNFAEVVLRFRTAGEIRLQVPIVPNTGFYSDIAPSTPPAAGENNRRPNPDTTEAPERDRLATTTPSAPVEPTEDESAEESAADAATNGPAGE